MENSISKKVHWTQFMYLIVFGIIIIISLSLTFQVVQVISARNTFKPDFKISIRESYNQSVEWKDEPMIYPEVIDCEVNVGSNTIRQDFYDFCPYVTKMIRMKMEE